MTLTDYDTPRADPEAPAIASLEALKAKRADSASYLGDDQDPYGAESDYAGLDDTELAVLVVPRQADEFTCTRCFLVHHCSQLVNPTTSVCRDCAT